MQNILTKMLSFLLPEFEKISLGIAAPSDLIKDRVSKHFFVNFNLTRSFGYKRFIILFAYTVFYV